ncbi:EAL domain-containing protein [Arsukibacterium sp.]|uniref:putative bifunctional diguanylate cyclase/phosphodiesterase n=1 Tax=Arsukibacterium sp. TaxID=1977258 RepID=UPI001BD1D145|nr:EAL domain-containing protein [Arsukibacterium sp.]
MTKNKSRAAAKTGEQPPSDLTQQEKKPISASRAIATWDGKSAKRENSLSEDEAALLCRKKLVAARENTVNARESASEARENTMLVREDAAQTREEATSSREDIAAKREDALQLTQLELQLKSSEHNAMLQEANTRLVLATLAAQGQTAQIEKVRVELEHLAHHDMLTNLPNRVLLRDRLSQAIEAAHRQGRQLGVMFMDIDRFKNINDTLGHAVGDQLLQSVARRLLTSIRVSDTVSRHGGDEFVLLLPFIEGPDGAKLSANKILTALAQSYDVGGHNLHITFSIGIAIYPADGEDAEALLKHADIAMFYAKESGRNNYRFFVQEMIERAVERQSIEASLHLALKRNEFVLHYQPKIDLHSGAIVGVEALIRWQHPQRGLLLPGHFVAIAEDCGLILPIGRWVLREACRQAGAWQKSGLPTITVAVNTSALEFRSEAFLENVRATLKNTGLDPHLLEIELTESILMRDVDSTNAVLHSLSDMGIRLSIDDFGTGYSSLNYLRRFPIHTLKIDKCFVNQLNANPDDATIVQAVISMGKSLHQRVIAEGVETQEQYAFLLAENCDEGQGYYFGFPMAPQSMAALLEAGGSLIPASD